MENGRKVHIVNVIDEFTRECLVPEVAFSIKQHDVVELLPCLLLVRGCPAHLRSDNGSQFTAARVNRFLEDLDVDTLFIEPGSPWENGYVESFNGRMRDKLLNGELFLRLDETKYVMGRRRMAYNHCQSHCSLSYLTPTGFLLESHFRKDSSHEEDAVHGAADCLCFAAGRAGYRGRGDYPQDGGK
ncbi:MAG: integrase core domain-containing protein [Planctomycetota bacterium]